VIDGHVKVRGLISALLGVAMMGAMASQAQALQPVDFTQETLPNGLRVIYAPLHQAPVVHVRVCYHVGSRDEQPDRQGFAHLFEHMMFRGSEHVKPEEHMRLIGAVGGYSNAYTSFDETVYHQTIPAGQLELALYLEADRMASFKVSDEIYRTERNVVTEEWRMYENRPYGHLDQEFFSTLFKKHPYRWTPIGDMNNLRAAQAAELQDFFNKYYVPNNAALIIAGDFDPDAAKALARKYFAWIPKGPDVKRDLPAEPEQTGPRAADVKWRVAADRVLVGFKAPPSASPDMEALTLLSIILGEGQSSRLHMDLVMGAKPLCTSAHCSIDGMEDGGAITVDATALAGHNALEIEKSVWEVLEGVSGGVREDELAKAKALTVMGLVRGRETIERIAGGLGWETLHNGDPARVNTAQARIQAVTLADIKNVAQKYLARNRAATVRVTADSAAPIVPEKLVDPVASTRPVEPRAVKFPEGYATKPPVSDKPLEPHLAKGTDLTTSSGVRVVVMPDSRLPMVNWTLAIRRGSDSDPPKKAGVARLAAAVARRGPAQSNAAWFNDTLESHGISLDVRVEGDVTKISCVSPADQADLAADLTRAMVVNPGMQEAEFAKCRERLINELRQADENASQVSDRELAAALFGPTSPMGQSPTPDTVGRITLDDAKAFCSTNWRPDGAVLVISGDVTAKRGQALADKLTGSWKPGPSPAPDYTLPAQDRTWQKLFVDRPDGKQSIVRMGILAYDITNDDKFAGDVAGRILSSGIDSRLGREVRAKKGLAYYVRGTFRPERHSGAFIADTGTTLPGTAEALSTMFKVFRDMRTDGVTDGELAEAKLRVAGGLVLGMQTVEQQAGLRLEGILNGYPNDYYDQYPGRIAKVTKEQVRKVMEKYVDPNRMVIVVVAPVDQLKDFLAPLGDVKVVPMPAKRRESTEPKK
jgi:zinc protease